MTRGASFAVVAVASACLAAVSAPGEADAPFTTFTIVARDAGTGDVGVATCSLAEAVGAVVPWARAGVGAVAAQAWAGADLGPRALDLLGTGLPPREALAKLLEGDARPERRQIGIVTAAGRSVSHTGRETLAYAGAIEAEDFTVLGNLLAGRETLEAMARSFRSTEGQGLPLAERLLRALEAGQSAGGDRRGGRSAALLTAAAADRAVGDSVNLRVDLDDHPVETLRRLHDARIGRLGHRRLSRPAGRDVAELQRLLKLAGFYHGEPDGVFDDATVAAVQAFRAAQGLYTGEQGGEAGLVDAALIERLRAWMSGLPPASTMKGPR